MSEPTVNCQSGNQPDLSRASRIVGAVLRPIMPLRWKRKLFYLDAAAHDLIDHYRDVARGFDGELSWFDVLIYVAPLQRRDTQQFRRGLANAARIPVDNDLDAAVPFLNGAIKISCEASSAEHAASRLLRIVRDALTEYGLTMEELRLEVVRTQHTDLELEVER